MRAARSAPSACSRARPSSKPSSSPASARSRMAAIGGRAAAMTVFERPRVAQQLAQVAHQHSGTPLSAAHCGDAGAQRRIEKARAVDVLGVDRQARLQRESLGAAGVGQRRHVRPRGFGIDVVLGQRRDAAPVVDAGGEQQAVIVGAQVGRRLDVHVAAHQPRDGDGAGDLEALGLRARGHRRRRLGAEVLDDDLLDVPVGAVQVANRGQAGDDLGARLADAEQDAGGERDRQLAGRRASSRRRSAGSLSGA